MRKFEFNSISQNKNLKNSNQFKFFKEKMSDNFLFSDFSYFRTCMLSRIEELPISKSRDFFASHSSNFTTPIIYSNYNKALCIQNSSNNNLQNITQNSDFFVDPYKNQDFYHEKSSKNIQKSSLFINSKFIYEDFGQILVKYLEDIEKFEEFLLEIEGLSENQDISMMFSNETLGFSHEKLAFKLNNQKILGFVNIQDLKIEEVPNKRHKRHIIAIKTKAFFNEEYKFVLFLIKTTKMRVFFEDLALKMQKIKDFEKNQEKSEVFEVIDPYELMRKNPEMTKNIEISEISGYKEKNHSFMNNFINTKSEILEKSHGFNENSQELRFSYVLESQSKEKRKGNQLELEKIIENQEKNEEKLGNQKENQENIEKIKENQEKIMRNQEILEKIEENREMPLIIQRETPKINEKAQIIQIENSEIKENEEKTEKSPEQPVKIEFKSLINSGKTLKNLGNSEQNFYEIRSEILTTPLRKKPRNPLKSVSFHENQNSAIKSQENPLKTLKSLINLEKSSENKEILKKSEFQEKSSENKETLKKSEFQEKCSENKENIDQKSSENKENLNQNPQLPIENQEFQTRLKFHEKILKEGPVFLKFGLRDLFRPSKTQIFFEDDLNRFYWGKGKKRKTFALEEIMEIRYGRNTKNFKRFGVSNKVKNQLCFSIMTLGRSIDLQAGSVKEKDQFLEALSQVMAWKKSWLGKKK